MEPFLRSLSKALFIAALLWMLPGAAQATNWYQNCASGNDSNGGTSFSDAVLTSARAAVLSSPGDTIYIAGGTCSDNFDLSAYDKGTSTSAFTVISGTMPYGVSGNTIVGPILTEEGAITLTGNTSWYIKLQDVHVRGANDDNWQGWGLFAKRVTFNGGCTSGNCTNFVTGDNEFQSGRMLFEDCIFLSSTTGSGRYQELNYQTVQIVNRRNIYTTRDGWSGDPDGSQPAALAASYNSGNVSYQNNIALDVVDYPEDPDESWHGAYYWVTNTGLNFDAGYNEWLGNIAINVAGPAFQNDGSQTVSQTALIQDFAGIDYGVSSGSDEYGLALGSGGGSRNYTINRATLHIASKTVSATGIGNFQSGTAGITNVIISNNSNDDLNGESATYFDTYNNGETATGTGQTTVNPRTSGLTYFTRIETGSTLKTAGSSGGQIGAEIQYEYGTDGTFYGDAGFNTLTANPLFPLEYEAERRVVICNTRGFGMCATAHSINKWVNGYGASPYSEEVDTSSPTAPGTPMVTSTGTTTLDISWSASTDDVGVSSYEIDVDNNSDFSSPLVGYNDQDIGSGTTEQLTGLSASTQYYFRLRAKDAAGNTSSNSTAGTGTTNAEAAPSSAIRGVSVGAGRRITVGPGRSVKF